MSIYPAVSGSLSPVVDGFMKENALKQDVQTYLHGTLTQATEHDRYFFQSLCKDIDLRKVDIIPNPYNVDLGMKRLAERYREVLCYPFICSPQSPKFWFGCGNPGMFPSSIEARVEKHTLVMVIQGVGARREEEEGFEIFPSVAIFPDKYPGKVKLEIGSYSYFHKDMFDDYKLLVDGSPSDNRQQENLDVSMGREGKRTKWFKFKDAEKPYPRWELIIDENEWVKGLKIEQDTF